MLRFTGLVVVLAVLGAAPAFSQTAEQCSTLAAQFTKLKGKHENMMKVLQQIDGRSREKAEQAIGEGGRKALNAMNESRERVIEALGVHLNDMNNFSAYLETCSS